MDLELKGRTALVTGASRGIGRAAAKVPAPSIKTSGRAPSVPVPRPEMSHPIAIAAVIG